MPKTPDPKAISDVVAEAARRAGRERAAVLHTDRDAPTLEDGGSPPRATFRTTGYRLQLRQDHGLARYYLGEKAVGVGDTIELYTNQANHWVRGRFEWSGQVEDRPCFAINLWDPDGPRDADGLPPWIGDLEGPVPAKAVFRWPTH